MKKLKFLVLPFAVLGCVLLLASCKGTGKFYYHGSGNEYIQITSDKWINSKGVEQDIKWISDTFFYNGSDLYYCDGEVLYSLKYTDIYYTATKRDK